MPNATIQLQNLTQSDIMTHTTDYWKMWVQFFSCLYDSFTSAIRAEETQHVVAFIVVIEI